MPQSYREVMRGVFGRKYQYPMPQQAPPGMVPDQGVDPGDSVYGTEDQPPFNQGGGVKPPYNPPVYDDTVPVTPGGPGRDVAPLPPGPPGPPPKPPRPPQPPPDDTVPVTPTDPVYGEAPMPPPPPMGPGIPIKPHFEEHGNDRPMGMMGNELPDEWEYNNPGALQQKIEMLKRLMLQVGAGAGAGMGAAPGNPTGGGGYGTGVA
jgi:hypothetical protein